MIHTMQTERQAQFRIHQHETESADSGTVLEKLCHLRLTYVNVTSKVLLQIEDIIFRKTITTRSTQTTQNIDCLVSCNLTKIVLKQPAVNNAVTNSIYHFFLV